MRCWVPWTVVITRIVHTRSYTSTLPWSHLTCSILQRNMSADKGCRKSSSKEVSSSTSGKSSPNNKNNGSVHDNHAGTGNSGSNSQTVETETDNEVRSTSPTTGDRVTRQSIRKREEIDIVKAKYLSLDLKTKRQLYKGTYVTLERIKTWPDYFREDLERNKDKSTLGEEKEVQQDLNKKISLFRGDITTLEIDAIVNAAHESLLGGGGVVIHTVGPRGENPQVLQQCYTHCLNLVKEYKLTSVAFPCISTGIFGYPNTNAAEVALSTVRQWLETEEYAKHVERVIFCLFLKVDVEAYHKLMPIYFPVEPSIDSNVNKSPSSDQSEKEEVPSPSSEEAKCDSKEEAELRKD